MGGIISFCHHAETTVHLLIVCIAECPETKMRDLFCRLHIQIPRCGRMAKMGDTRTDRLTVCEGAACTPPHAHDQRAGSDVSSKTLQ